MKNKEEIKDMNKYNKIRKLLGKDYHLSITCNFDGPDKWFLYKKYNDPKVYFSNDNEPIMTSEENNIEDLLVFAKQHHKIDEHFVMSYFRTSVLFAMFVLATINCFINNSIVRTIIYTVGILLLIECLISSKIWNKNFEIEKKEMLTNLFRDITTKEK